MNKLDLAFIFTIITFGFLAINPQSYADVASSMPKNTSVTPTICSTLDEEISNLEKEYSHNSQLLATRKHEIEKLPAEASSTKMKLTADTFMIAAKLETAQNWIKVKRNEKQSKKCPSVKHK